MQFIFEIWPVSKKVWPPLIYYMKKWVENASMRRSKCVLETLTKTLWLKLLNCCITTAFPVIWDLQKVKHFFCNDCNSSRKLFLQSSLGIIPLGSSGPTRKKEVQFGDSYSTTKWVLGSPKLDRVWPKGSKNYLIRTTDKKIAHFWYSGI